MKVRTSVERATKTNGNEEWKPFFLVSEAASSVEQRGVPGSVSLGAPSERVALPGAPGQH